MTSWQTRRLAGSTAEATMCGIGGSVAETEPAGSTSYRLRRGSAWKHRTDQADNSRNAVTHLAQARRPVLQGADACVPSR
jgi:hypothetical protein